MRMISVLMGSRNDTLDSQAKTISIKKLIFVPKPLNKKWILSNKMDLNAEVKWKRYIRVLCSVLDLVSKTGSYICTYFYILRPHPEFTLTVTGIWNWFWYQNQKTDISSKIDFDSQTRFGSKTETIWVKE